MAKKLTVSSVKPSQINTSKGFYGTIWGSSEVESVARAIVVISKARRSWAKFTWEDYKERCTHHTTDTERGILDNLVSEEYLVWEGDSYSITDRFIRALSRWITQ